MDDQMLRWDFLRAASAAAGVATVYAQNPESAAGSSHIRLEPFDYQGVSVARW